MLRLKERKQWAGEFGSIAEIPPRSGSTVTLADLAEIRDGFEEVGLHFKFNGQPSVEVEIFRMGTQSPLEIASAVQIILKDIESTLPPGIQVRIDSNRARDYHDRLSLLVKNGLIAVFIVLFILAAFLKLRLAFWVMMGMTISFVDGLMFLPFIGVSITMISMFAFLVVLGIVVDEAIVVGENICEHRQQGLDFLPAAIAGAWDIAGPVTLSIF